MSAYIIKIISLTNGLLVCPEPGCLEAMFLLLLVCFGRLVDLLRLSSLGWRWMASFYPIKQLISMSLPDIGALHNIPLSWTMFFFFLINVEVVHTANYYVIR